MDNETFYLVQYGVYLKEISWLVNECEKIGIRLIILKGIPLYDSILHTIPQKKLADCDILIHPEDTVRLTTILKQRGYVIRKIKSKEHENQLPEMSFTSIITSIPITFDVHREAVFMFTQLNVSKYLYPPQLLSEMTEEMFSGKRMCKVKNVQFPILSRRHLLPYLTLHFFHHNYKGLSRLEFIHQIILHEDYTSSDWKEIAEFIVRYQLERFVWPIIPLLMQFEDISIPKAFSESIENTMRYSPVKLFHITIKDVNHEESKFISRLHRLVLLILLSPNPWHLKIRLIFEYKLWRNIINIGTM